jgi:glutaredoxin
MEAFPNARTVPQIIFDDKNIGGYEELVQKLK